MTSGTLRTILIVGAAIAVADLAACKTLTPAQGLEQADTAASLAYATTATAVNAYEAANPAGRAKAEALKLKAWGLLQQERALYTQGQDVAAVLGELQALEAQAKELH